MQLDGDHQQRGQLEDDLRALDRGQVLAKTAGDVMQAFALAVRLRQPRRLRSLLYLFDAPGEHFATMERFGRKQILQHLGGIILLIDPFALPPLETRGRRLHAGIKPSGVPLDKVAATLINGVNSMLLRQPTQKCQVPLAVVIGKADAHPSLDKLCPRSGGPHAPDLSPRCRLALQRLGAGNAIRALEQKFEKVSYFASSPLGRLPDLRNTSAFQPVGVIEPFAWLLGLQLT